MSRLEKAVTVMREVQADCERDAVALDATAFTPRGVGERLGEMLAMIQAVARGVEVVGEALLESKRGE